MPHFKSSKILHLNAQDIFNIIIDIEAYPKFLGWCASSRIISKENDIIIAELTINYKGYNEKYVSEVKTSSSNNNYKIEVTAISGPFKYLNNIWEIEKVVDGCLVDFFIDFELKNFILAKLMNSFFKKATATMADSFEKRAKEIIRLKNNQHFSLK